MRDRLRMQMPVVDRYAYFDHAAVGPLPRKSEQAISSYAATAATHGDAKWLDWSAGLGRLRKCAAQLIHATPEEIAFLNNTTQGLHIVAEGLPWQPGDNVVYPENEFPSNALPWEGLQRLGVEVRRVPVAADGVVSLQKLEDAIDGRTRLLAISWVGFLSGFRISVQEVVDLAHRRGCLVCLDAIQGLGAFPLSVVETGVDFVCADGHKWMLGPEGAGFAFIRREHIERLRPVGAGWASLAAGSFEPGASVLKDTAARFEGGSYNMPGLLGLGASLEVLLDAGANQTDSPVAAAILENVSSLEKKLRSAGFEVSLPEKQSDRSGILSVSWQAEGGNAVDYTAARKHCLNDDIVTSVRGGRLRVAAHAYNNESDAHRLVESLVAYRESES